MGKSYLARGLGKSFRTFLEINFESQPEFIPIFEKYLGEPVKLIREIELRTGVQLIAGESLLFLDEIQECAAAVKSLRYFYEKHPEQHVIAAGSLLEFLFQEISFPVGRVQFLRIFPMSFEEFLWAENRKDLSLVLESIETVREISESTHEVLTEFLENYLVVGGLPEVVRTHIETRSADRVQEVLQLLVASYRDDFNKYGTRAQVPHLRTLFDNIPRVLGQKFMYSQVAPESRARDIAPALDLLCQSGLATRCHHSSANGVPLSAQIKQDRFKIFFLDVGLTHRALGLRHQQVAADRKRLLTNRGGLAEQFIAQQLLSFTGANEEAALYYWIREQKNAQAEVDFVIQGRESYSDQVIPIEVKAGESSRARSLAEFMKEKNSKLGFLFSSAFGVRERLGRIEMPLYAVGALKGL